MYIHSGCTLLFFASVIRAEENHPRQAQPPFIEMNYWTYDDDMKVNYMPYLRSQLHFFMKSLYLKMPLLREIKSTWWNRWQQKYYCPLLPLSAQPPLPWASPALQGIRYYHTTVILQHVCDQQTVPATQPILPASAPSQTTMLHENAIQFVSVCLL